MVICCIKSGQCVFRPLLPIALSNASTELSTDIVDEIRRTGLSSIYVVKKSSSLINEVPT